MTPFPNSLEFDERSFLSNNENYHIHRVETFDKMYAKLHEHDFVEIFILLSGEVSYVIEEGSFELRDFDIVIVPPHTLHKLVVHSREVPYRRLVLWIRRQYIEKLSSSSTRLYEAIENMAADKQYLIRRPEFTFDLKPYLEKIRRLQNEGSYGTDLLVENTFRELFIEMNQFLKNENDQVVNASGNPIVLSVVRYIEEHLSEDLSLHQISSGLNLDAFYLSHVFSKEVGTTIHKFIIKKRLNQGKKLLEEGHNVKEVVPLVGFKDESHFIQSFKKEYGSTPKQYRKNLQSAM